jgi:hypothetical protein
MSAKPLLGKNPHPTAEETQAALTGNLCRCSAYNRYVEATLAASGAAIPVGGTAQFAGEVSPLQTVGHPTTRIDPYERVTGRANYTAEEAGPLPRATWWARNSRPWTNLLSNAAHIQFHQ